MTKLSPRKLFFIVGSTLALVATSRGDDTVVSAAADTTETPITEAVTNSDNHDLIDPQEAAPMTHESEPPTCECPPDLSEQLRRTLTTECGSKLELLNNDIKWFDTELNHCKSYHTTFVEDTERKIEEHTARSTVECDSKLAVSDGDIKWFETELDQCRSQHAVYVENTTKGLLDADHKFDQLRLESVAMKDEQLALKSEISSLTDADTIQTEECENSVSTCNNLLSSSRMESTQCGEKIQECKADHTVAVQRVKSLQKEHDALQSVRKQYAQCREEKAECLSDHNKALQKQGKLQKDHDRIESLHKTKVNNMKKEQSKQRIEIEQLKNNAKRYSDKYYDEREKVNGLEKDLRLMRRKAEVTYVNTTLVKQDIVGFTSRNLNRAYDAVDTGVSKVQEHPMAELVNVKARVIYEVTIDHMEHLYSTLKELYVQHCSPTIHRGLDSIQDSIKDTPTWKMYGAPGLEKVSEMQVGISLTIASAVKETSTVGLDYIELTAKDNEGVEYRWILEYIKQGLTYMKMNSGNVATWIMIGILCMMLIPSLLVDVILFIFHTIVFVILLPFYPFLILRNLISESST